MKTIEKKMKLMVAVMAMQLFADAGTLVNATGNYINAYTGDVTAFDDAHTLVHGMKVFYDTMLLQNARTQQFYAQFGLVQKLPANHGETVEWRKWNEFAKAGVLTEGVIPTGQKFGQTKIQASIFQLGTYTSISDRLELHYYDPVLAGASEEMSASMYETRECKIRDGLLAGTNVLYCDNINLSTGAKIGNTPTTCAALKHNDTDGYGYLTPTMVNRAATILKKAKAPKINGKYYAVVHTSVAHDLRQNKEWIDITKYAGPQNLMNGEIGELHGVRFIENPDAPVLKGTIGSVSYTSGDSGCTYATYFFGKDAFGIIDAEGGSEMIVHDKSEAGGPLNQFSTVGYKFETNGATILYQTRMLRVMSVSSYSGTDVKNC